MDNIEAISESLEDKSLEWSVDEGSYNLTHKKSGIRMWISGGESFLRIVEPIKIIPDGMTKKGLWVSAQICLDNLLAKAVKKL